MNDPVAYPLPMFPLGTVLFPHTVLPLRIFEERYRALARDCTRGDGRFGVVLIERGSEVGGGDSRFGVGTEARIIEAVELPDGEWLLAVVGEQRLKVRTWLPDDPYPLALVEVLDEVPLEPSAGETLRDAERTVRRALAYKAELGDPAPSVAFTLDGDPTRAAYQLAAVAPLGPFDHQHLLEMADPLARLTSLIELTAQATEVLGFRLGDGGSGGAG